MANNNEEIIVTKSNNNDVYMLTTIDNPYNPFTQFDDWLAYDTQKGYNTCGYLDRIAHSSHELSDEDNNLEIARAIDEIVSLNINGLYTKVTKDNFKKRDIKIIEEKE